MLKPLFSPDDVQRSGFAETVVGRCLGESAVGLTDVGARWGVSPLFSPLARYCDVLALEPDQSEALRIRAARESALWRGLTVKELALASERGALMLYILRRPNNSSIYPVIPHCYQRYKLKGFELEREVQVQAVKLDDVIFADADAHRWGEIIKIDAQGAELDILKGTTRTLTSLTQCIVCEVNFFSAYEGVPLFSEVESFLRAQGFRLYGLLDLQQRSTRQLDKTLYRGRERLMQADAVFFRDPLDTGTPLRWPENERSFSVLVAATLLTGCFDYCLELVGCSGWSGAEKAGLAQTIKALAGINSENVWETIDDLAQKVARNPDNRLITVGRYIDQNRDFHTYHDVQVD